MGSALRLPVVRQPDATAARVLARMRGCRLVATVARGGTSLFKADLNGPVALFLGAEGQGLDAAIVNDADIRVTIPMEPPVESLNAAVAAALVAYECRRQRQAQRA
jgi:TrmH family RNA methyltransferase